VLRDPQGTAPRKSRVSIARFYPAEIWSAEAQNELRIAAETGKYEAGWRVEGWFAASAAKTYHTRMRDDRGT